MSKRSEKIFTYHLKTAWFAGISAGSVVASFVLFRMPFFLDNALDLAIFSWGIPLFLSTIAAILFHFIRRMRKTSETQFRPTPKYLPWIALLLTAALIGLYLVRSSTRNFKIASKVFLFAVDGATWSIINPLIEKGRLPTIAKFKKDGSYAVLQSIEPTLSPVLWTTIATGKNSEKHGVKDFYSTQDSLRTKRLWDIFEAEGMRIGVFKWLITWPPKKVNGFMIPDILARDERTFPPEYSAINSLRISEKSLRSEGILGYGKRTLEMMNLGLRMSTLRVTGWELFRNWMQNGDGESRYPLKRRAELRINKDVFVYLLKKHQPQFVAFYDNGVDILSHRYWKYYQPNNFASVSAAKELQFGHSIPDYYELIDQTLAELLNHFNPGALVVIVSDHGMQASDQQGEDRFSPKLSEILKHSEIDSIVYQIALGRRFYVRLKDPSQTNLLTTVQERLEKIRIAETGEKLFNSNQDNTGLIIRVNQKAVNFDHHVQIGNESLKMDKVVYRQPPNSGIHHLEGIFLARGPNVRAGIKIPDASILDIAPTILYLAKAPISQETDGRILFPAISEDFQKATSARLVPDSETNKLSPAQRIEFDKQIEERLKSLGYVQ